MIYVFKFDNHPISTINNIEDIIRNKEPSTSNVTFKKNGVLSFKSFKSTIESKDLI